MKWFGFNIMKLLIKQITKELLKNKVFLMLMFILTVFTSFVYFFVHFSVDANMNALKAQANLSSEQLLLYNALTSNTTLAKNALLVFICITAFVIGMFFCRFFRASSKMIGGLKSLGFKNSVLSCYFVIFTAVLSIAGAVFGLFTGYFASDILIEANRQSYLVDGLVKGISAESLVIGSLFTTAVFCAITFLSFNTVRNKEVSVLIEENDSKTDSSLVLRSADKISRLFPVRNRLKIRLALRKPMAALLVVFSVMIFTIMSVLGYSLTLSSKRVFESQTIGHNYELEVHYDKPQASYIPSDKAAYYVDTKGIIKQQNMSLEAVIAGVEDKSDIYKLLDKGYNTLEFPKHNEVVIGSRLNELYGFKVGEEIKLLIDGNELKMRISGIAFNAKANWIYIAKEQLEQILLLEPNSYTGAFCMENILAGGDIVTNEQKLDSLDREAVSNRVSAVINHVIGFLVGCISLFLALLLNFQSCTRDILILQLAGYRKREIKSMLLDIYRPIVLLSFLITLLPAVMIVKAILRSLSIQIGDYMPFQTNIIVIMVIFVLINAIYFTVQASFSIGIGRVIRNENVSDYTG